MMRSEMEIPEEGSHRENVPSKILEGLENTRKELPSIFNHLESILLRIAIFILFVYGLWRLMRALIESYL